MSTLDRLILALRDRARRYDRWTVFLTAVAKMFAFAVLFIGMLYGTAERKALFDKWASHTRVVELELRELIFAVVDAESACRGYLLTGLDEARDRFEAAGRQVDGRVARLAGLTRDNPSQQARIGRLRAAIRAKFLYLRELMTIRETRQWGPAISPATARRGVALMGRVRALVGEMEAEESRLLEGRAERARGADRNHRVADGLVMVGIAAWFFWGVAVAWAESVGGRRGDTNPGIPVLPDPAGGKPDA